LGDSVPRCTTAIGGWIEQQPQFILCSMQILPSRNSSNWNNIHKTRCGSSPWTSLCPGAPLPRWWSRGPVEHDDHRITTCTQEWSHYPFVVKHCIPAHLHTKSVGLEWALQQCRWCTLEPRWWPRGARATDDWVHIKGSQNTIYLANNNHVYAIALAAWNHRPTTTGCAAVLPGSEEHRCACVPGEKGLGKGLGKRTHKRGGLHCWTDWRILSACIAKRMARSSEPRSCPLERLLTHQAEYVVVEEVP